MKDEGWEFSEQDLAQLLREVATADLELEVRDLSGGRMLSHPVPAQATVEDAIRDIVAHAGLPQGRYALFALRESGDPVRLDAGRSLGECLADLGLEGQTRLSVVLAPELEGN
jgi:hypothetical protein